MSEGIIIALISAAASLLGILLKHILTEQSNKPSKASHSTIDHRFVFQQGPRLTAASLYYNGRTSALIETAKELSSQRRWNYGFGAITFLLIAAVTWGLTGDFTVNPFIGVGVACLFFLPGHYSVLSTMRDEIRMSKLDRASLFRLRDLMEKPNVEWKLDNDIKNAALKEIKKQLKG